MDADTSGSSILQQFADDTADSPESGARSSIHEPPPAVVAALEYQVAALVHDQRSTLNWRGREIVVNTPGGFKRKQARLHQIAASQFRGRGDVEDVLSDTIVEYGLWQYANPFGFWTAFRRNIFDVAKSGLESMSVPLEQPSIANRSRLSGMWAPSPESRLIESDATKSWIVDEASRLHSLEPAVSEKWLAIRNSDDPLDELIRAAGDRLMADDRYLEELSHTDSETANMTRLVAEIRAIEGCSKAEAYRLLARFRQGHSAASRKENRAGPRISEKNRNLAR
jgi:hypothetical protein